MRSNFGYNGSNKAAKEFVETVNELVKIIEGMSVNMGASGGRDIVSVRKLGESIEFDFSQVYIPAPPP